MRVLIVFLFSQFFIIFADVGKNFFCVLSVQSCFILYVFLFYFIYPVCFLFYIIYPVCCFFIFHCSLFQIEMLNVVVCVCYLGFWVIKIEIIYTVYVFGCCAVSTFRVIRVWQFIRVELHTVLRNAVFEGVCMYTYLQMYAYVCIFMHIVRIYLFNDSACITYSQDFFGDLFKVACISIIYTYIC